METPRRILLGPGPSEVSPRVLAALARPTVGYVDPTCVAMLEDLGDRLRRLFCTDNEATFAVTGSGSAAMECALVNTVAPGERALVVVHGFFGDRMRQILERCGAEVELVSAPWGGIVEPERVDEALRRRGGTKVVAVVHGETSTGVEHPVAELAAVAHRHDALLVVDTVASLGGVAFDTDGIAADVVYSAAQKCLSVPPGTSPITFGPRAMQRIRGRTRPCTSWYLDVELNLSYWHRPHRYHHTGPINLLYGLQESLIAIEEEGLANRIARTRRTAEALWAGLEALGLHLFVDRERRLPTLTTVRVPDGVDELRVRKTLLDRYGIEIAGGLGEIAGKVWRVGLMGTSCTRANVVLLLAALEQALEEQGHRPARPAASVVAANLLASDGGG